MSGDPVRGAVELGELPLSAWPGRATCTAASHFQQNSSGVSHSVVAACLRVALGPGSLAQHVPPVFPVDSPGVLVGEPGAGLQGREPGKPDLTLP